MRWSFIVLAGAVAVVSTASILIRLAQAEGASSLTIAAVRLGLAAAILAPFAWLKAGREIMLLGRRELGLCLLSGMFLAMHFWTWISSLEYTSVASSAALVTTNPLWVGLASAVLLRESPAPAALAGIALTVAGSVLIFAADSGGSEGAATNPLLATRWRLSERSPRRAISWWDGCCARAYRSPPMSGWPIRWRRCCSAPRWRQAALRCRHCRRRHGD